MCVILTTIVFKCFDSLLKFLPIFNFFSTINVRNDYNDDGDEIG